MPGFFTVNFADFPPSMYLVLNAPFTAARSWVAPSLFFTVIGVPAVTVNLFGTNLKPLIVTDVTGGLRGGTAVAAPAVDTPIPPTARVSSSANVVATSRVVMRGRSSVRATCDEHRARGRRGSQRGRRTEAVGGQVALMVPFIELWMLQW